MRLSNGKNLTKGPGFTLLCCLNMSLQLHATLLPQQTGYCDCTKSNITPLSCSHSNSKLPEPQIFYTNESSIHFPICTTWNTLNCALKKSKLLHQNCHRMDQTAFCFIELPPLATRDLQWLALLWSKFSSIRELGVG